MKTTMHAVYIHSIENAPSLENQQLIDTDLEKAFFSSFHYRNCSYCKHQIVCPSYLRSESFQTFHHYQSFSVHLPLIH